MSVAVKAEEGLVGCNEFFVLLYVCVQAVVGGGAPVAGSILDQFRR